MREYPPIDVSKLYGPMVVGFGLEEEAEGIPEVYRSEPGEEWETPIPPETPEIVEPAEPPPGFMQKLAGAAEWAAGQPPWSTITQAAIGLGAGVAGFLKETLFERPVNMWMQFADGLNYDFEEMMKQPNMDYMLFNLIDQTGRTFKESWKDIDWDNIERITEYERNLAHYEVTDPAARATLEFIGAVPTGVYTFFDQAATLGEYKYPELMAKYPSIGAAIRTIGNFGELAAFGAVFKALGTRGYRGIEYTPKELGVVAREMGEIPRVLPQPEAFAEMVKPTKWPFGKVTPEERAAFRGEVPVEEVTPFVPKKPVGEEIPPSVPKLDEATATRAAEELNRPELANAKALDITKRIGEWEVDKTTHDIDALEAEALSLHKRVTPTDFELEADFDRFITGVENVLSHVRRIKRRDMSPLEEPSSIQVNPRPLASGEAAGKIVYNADGKPFNNEATAQAWSDLNGLEGVPVENPTGSGWVLVTKEPFVPKITIGERPEVQVPFDPYKEFIRRRKAEEVSPLAEGTDSIGGAINKTLKDGLNEKGEIEVPEVLIRGVNSLREFFRFNTWADPRSEVYKNVTKLVDDRRISHNLSAFDAIDMRESLLEILPEAGERKQIPHFIEGREVSMSPAMEFVAEVAVRTYENSKSALIDAGVKAQESFLEGYVNHIIIDPLQTHEAVSWMKKRVRKPGGFETFTLRELEKAGYKVEKDIAKLLPLYMYHTGRAIGNKAFADSLRYMKNPAGDWVILSEQGINKKTAVTHISLDAESLSRWSGFAKKHSTTEARPDVFKGRTFVDRNAFMPINGIISTFIPEVYGKVAHVRTGVKRIIMYNPLIHGVNIESNVIMGVGFRKYFTKEHFGPTRILGKSDLVKDKNLLREMVANGMQLEGLYDVGRRLGQDIFELRELEKITWKDVHKDPRLLMVRPIGVLKGLGDELLWDKWVKTGQISLYNVLKERFMKEGLGNKEAGRAAALMTNDLMGTLPTNWFTKNQRNILRMLMFARNWNVSNFRTLTGALPREAAKSRFLPKPLRFEGMNDAQLNAMGKQYRYVLLRGAIGIVVTANAVQAAFLAAHSQPFHPIWENEKDHKFDIDTGRVDSKGRRVYFKDHLFRQVDDYIKFATKDPLGVAKAKSEPILRTIIEMLFNIDYRGEKIRQRGMTYPEKALAQLKHIVAGVTPLDTFVGREDEIRNWRDSLLVLTGTWIRRGMPAGGDPVVANLLKEYYDYHARGEYQRSKAKGQISRLIQLGKIDEAITKTISAVKQHQLSPEAFASISMKLGMPFLYRVSMMGKRLKPDFLRLLNSLPEEDRQKYLEAISRIGAKGVLESPRILVPPTPQEERRFETIGEWEILR